MLSYFFYILSYYCFFKLVGRTRAPPHFLLFIFVYDFYIVFHYAVTKYLFFIIESRKTVFDLLHHINKIISGIVTHAGYNRDITMGFDHWVPWGAQYFVEHRAPMGAPNIILKPETASKHLTEHIISHSICAATFRFLYDNDINKFVIGGLIRVAEILNIGRPWVPQFKLIKTIAVSTRTPNSIENDTTFLYDNEIGKITINRCNFKNMCLY